MELLYAVEFGEVLYEEQTMFGNMKDDYAEHSYRYNSYPPFPNGCKGWEDFAASMQRDQEIYFALRTMEYPKHNHYTLHLNRREYPVEVDPLTFGVLTRRSDGKIGRLCFREATREEKEKSGKSYVRFDGLGKLDLHLAQENTKELVTHFYVPSKISAMYFRRNEMEKALIRWLSFQVAGVEANLDKERARELAELRTIMREYLPDRDQIHPEIAKLLNELDRKLALYVKRLEARKDEQIESMRELENEILSLQ